DYYEVYQKSNNITIIRFKSSFNPKIIKSLNNNNDIILDINSKENASLDNRRNLKPIKYNDKLWINYPGFYENIVKIKIPEDGRILNIILGGKEIGRIADIYDYPFFTLLPSIQGVVIDYKDDILPITVLLDGISIDLKYNISIKKKEIGNYSKFFYRPCQWKKLNKSNNFYSDKVELFNKTLNSSVDDIVDNRLNIVKFYLLNKMHNEAANYMKYLIALEKNSHEINYGLSILHAISLYMNRRYEEAGNTFYSIINSTEYQYLSEMERAELKIWYMSSNINLWVEIQGDILRDVDSMSPLALESIFECYMPNDKISFLLLFFKQSVYKKQLEKVQKLREILDDKEMSLYDRNEYLLNLAKFLIDTGDLDLARSFYEKVKNSKDYMHHLVAIFMMTKYDHDKKIISTKDAIEKLVEIKKSAPNNALFLGELLEYLGDLYIKDGDYYNALYTLDSVRNTYNSQSMVEITRKIGDIFSYVFNHEGHIKLTSKQIVELFIDFKNFISIGDEGVYTTLTYIDALEKLDLIDDTIKELTHLVRYRLYGEKRIDALSRLFFLILKSDKVDDITNIYNELDPMTMSSLQDNVKIMSMIGKGLSLQNYKDGLKLLDNIKERNISTLRVKSDILWSAKDYTGINRLLQDFLIYRDNPDAPLTLFEYESIYRLAVAYLSMNERTPLLSLYNSYKDFFNQDNIFYTKLIKLFGKVVDINKKDSAYIKDLSKLTDAY
ncbi:MAG: hypothetical protein OEY79_03545, partial [Anaplasmataceae bacterium]|nr:hypothetical protein [Anaplasmataceae bacterium]